MIAFVTFLNFSFIYNHLFKKYFIINNTRKAFYLIEVVKVKVVKNFN